ncbi:hypothetical protein [Pseudoroseomonas ludipueritiae]|uniref:Uncharacterized protein n=1 Tax=Pseudoroseomonas ludipueritiae TaxID=198093 RepID=A0ABR7REB3_9PROT|nr:hypothetical protein [Pseudoroseomonas ludipueritiae]MBC9180221.1 hypothetical protein [Pseudoroseomonas ludipueritiae]
MTNIISLSEARAAYRRNGDPIPENLRDPHAPMRGILTGIGGGAILWILAWSVLA